MLEARNISYTYAEDDTPLFEHVSLCVEAGEFVALAGPNGGGKTTLARILAGSLKADQGWVALDGNTAHVCWPHVGYVRQDPQSQLVSEIVFDEVAFGLETLGLPAEEMQERVQIALSRCGIAHLAQAVTSNLSGGEQQRLALAGVLAAEPAYLVLDEPTAFLDPESRTSFVRLLRVLADGGTGILMVTHRREEMDAADRVLHIDELVGATSTEGASAEPQFDLSFMGTGHSLYVEGATVERVTVRAMDEVSIIAPASKITLIMGHSGAGKTTCALTMCGVLKPEAGIAFLGDEKVRIGEVGLCMQRPEDQLFCPTVIEDVMFGPRNAGLSEDEARSRAEEALTSMGVSPKLWGRQAMALSGGERRRVAIACSIAMDYDAYVFDEPTAALDERGCLSMRALARGLAQAGKAVVVISHDLDAWLDIADSAVRLCEGRVTYAGEVHDLQAIPQDKPRVKEQRRSTNSSLLSLVPAGAKVLGLAVATILLFSVMSPVTVVAGAFASLIIAALAGVRPKDVPELFGVLAIVFVFALLANAIVVDGTGSIALFGTVGISQEGLLRGCLSVLRIVSLVLLVAAVANSTPTSRIAKALLAPLRPLARMGVPVQAIYLTVALSLRSLPFGFEEYERISIAQRIRRAQLGKGGLSRRLSSWMAVLVPMIVALMHRADELGDALADRGYGR